MAAQAPSKSSASTHPQNDASFMVPDTERFEIGSLFQETTARKIALVLKVTQPVHALHRNGHYTVFPPHTALEVIGTFNTFQGMPYAKVVHCGVLYSVRLHELSTFTTPTARVLHHVWSRTDELMPDYIECPEVGADEYTIEAVRITVHSAHLKLFHDGADTVTASTDLDVLRIHDDTGLKVVRDSSGREFVLAATVLDCSSELKQVNVDAAIDDRLHTDSVEDYTKVDRLFLVRQDFVAYAGSRTKAVLKRNHMVRMREWTRDVVTFETTKGQLFALASGLLERYMLELDLTPEDQHAAGGACNNVSAVGADGSTVMPWQAHKWHCGTAFEAPPSAHGSPEVFNLPQTRQYLPLPPAGYVPDLATPESGSSPFGHWRFSTSADADEAKKLGFDHASLVIHAAQQGRPGLGHVHLAWTPGTIEGTQGVGFRSCSAYIHIYVINFRRKFWFGEGPVPSQELAVYTGSDEFWLERPGADGHALDDFKAGLSYQHFEILDESQIEQQILERRGYYARVNARRTAGPTSIISTEEQEEALQLLLKACDRRVMLGLPMVNQGSIDLSKPLKKRTAFHPGYVQYANTGVMHPSNFLEGTLKDKMKPGFVVHPRARLNADGETTWTIVNRGQSPRHPKWAQVMQEDLPFLPSCINVDASDAFLNSLRMLGASLDQILAYMDEATQQYSNYYSNRMTKFRDPLGLAPPVPRGIYTTDRKIVPSATGGKVNDAVRQGRNQREALAKARVEADAKQRQDLLLRQSSSTEAAVAH